MGGGIIMHRRIFALWIGVAITLAVLTGRLFMLAVFPDGLVHQALRWQDETRVRAQLEHMRGVVTDDARGRILFRNGLPITGSVRPQLFTTGSVAIHYVQHSEQTTQSKSAGSATKITGSIGQPDVWPSSQRVVAEQGRSGLEARFDALLRGQRPGYLGVIVPATHSQMRAQSISRSDSSDPPPSSAGIHSTPRFYVAPLAGANLRTTLDPAWQSVADHALAQAAVATGAVVVIDVPSNEVLAMANLSSDSTNPLPSVHAATPGSVFKLVTAAAAYESYRFGPDAHFTCDGLSTLAGVNMRCWRTHGRETLTTAIAQSCDVALAEVGVSVGRKGLETAWARLHLNESELQTTAGDGVLAEAESGQLFRQSGSDNGLLANTAIGQEDVRITPLQAANLARTIATRGVYSDVRLVLDAKRPGNRKWTLPRGRQSRVLSGLTAANLSEGMRRCVSDQGGTAHDLAWHTDTLAAKTGTAELANGRVNAWLMGYLPADHPRIAFCVFSGNTASASGHAAVHQITQALLQAYRQFPPVEVIG